MAVSFVLRGQRFTLTREEVVTRLEDMVPEPVFRHAVLVEDVLWPVKQVFGAATGLDRLDFTTKDARAPLIALGFSVVRIPR